MTRLVLSPDVLVRIQQGRLIVQCPHNGVSALALDEPGHVALLLRFAAPREPQTLIGSLPLPIRPMAEALLRHAQNAGVLLDENIQTTQPQSKLSAEQSQTLLSSLALNAYGLACDLKAYGAYAEEALSANTGLGVESRLLGILAGVESLRRELEELRPRYVTEQLQRLGLTPESGALNLHIGAGEFCLDGWVNIDVSPAQLSLNVMWGLPFSDNTVHRVFLSHMFEHLFYPNEAAAFLHDLLRVLEPGGVVRIIVPDTAKAIHAYAENDDTYFRSRKATLDWWPEGRTHLEDFLAYSGAGPNPAHFFEAHKYGYDFETLARLLANVGFTSITESQYMASEWPELRVDEHSLVAGARYDDTYYSLFVEARKPLSD